jgi:hypothetical protein
LLEAGLSKDLVRCLLTQSTDQQPAAAAPGSPLRSPSKGEPKGKGAEGKASGNGNDDDVTDDDNDNNGEEEEEEEEDESVEVNDDVTVLRGALDAVLLRGAGGGRSQFALSSVELCRESMLRAKKRNAHRMAALKV